MALPLPRVVADVGPGGSIVTSMRGQNALSQDMLDTKIKGIEAQYKPTTLQAEAASKLAYANLMGPQFLAKLMGHDPILANMSEDQKRNALNLLYQSGTGQGTGNALINMPGHPAQGGNPYSGWLTNKLKGIFGDNSQQPSTAPQQQPNALASSPIDQSNLSAQDRQGINALQPGGSYVIQGNGQQGRGADSGYAYNPDGTNAVASPQEIAAAASGGNPNASAQPNRTFSENTGAQAGIVEEGKELGKSRAAAIEDLGKQQMDLSSSGVILDRLVQITQNPEFQKMRSQIPYFQDKQLWYLSKNGTKEQQDMIGDLISTAQAFKASTVNSFKGKALEKEFNLADKIKIDENDTMGVIQGKLRSLKTLKQIAETKNDIILGLMSQKHMNLGDATKIANKQVNTSAIEKEVDSVLNPQPTEHDIQYMMQKRNLPREEIVKQLRARGYKNVS
jgi:NACalpha-BTF3-like transcription factor